MSKIGRKDFLRQSAKLGGSCSAALLAAAFPAPAEESNKPGSAFTPSADRVNQGQEVIKRLIAQMDQRLDKASRDRIMESCGRLCHNSPIPRPHRSRLRPPQSSWKESARTSARRTSAGRAMIPR
jgi:hypothetical protein